MQVVTVTFDVARYRNSDLTLTDPSIAPLYLHGRDTWLSNLSCRMVNLSMQFIGNEVENEDKRLIFHLPSPF